MFSEWGGGQTSSALVGEFVHLGQARFHLQKILHSNRLPLPKLQEGLLLFKPALSISDKEVSQALLVCGEEVIKVTERLSHTGHGVQVS